MMFAPQLNGLQKKGKGKKWGAISPFVTIRRFISSSIIRRLNALHLRPRAFLAAGTTLREALLVGGVDAGCEGGETFG